MKIHIGILPAIGLVIALQTGLLFFSDVSAKVVKKAIATEANKETVAEEIKSFFVKDSDSELLNSLAQIEADLKNHNMDEVHGKFDEISNYLEHYKNEAEKHKAENVQLSEKYKGDKVLVLEYGDWFSSRKVILSLNPGTTVFNLNSMKDRISLSSYFKKNEIDDASVEYVTYNTDSDKFRLALHKLLSGIEERNSRYIRDGIKNIYN